MENNIPPTFTIGSKGESRASSEEPKANDYPASTSHKKTETDGLVSAGKTLAAALEAEGYHPVVVFGNAASGKTSLLLSLLAYIKTVPSLDCGFILGDPVLDVDTEYGNYLKILADQFFGRRTQDFIEGRASPKTNIDYPFVIPLILRPRGRPEFRVAFVESNGEWYRPNRDDDRLFPALKTQLEDFLRSYQKGVSFLHLIPYTQTAVRMSGSSKIQDKEQIAEASLAIAGALTAYETVRLDKSRDRHLMLVTKWDAHKVPGSDLYGVLNGPSDAALPFVSQNYGQAYAAYRGLNLREDQCNLTVYCSGLISGQDVLTLSMDNDLRPSVLRFPRRLWGWLYRHALEDAGNINVPYGPFPGDIDPRPSFWQRFINWLKNLF